MKKIILTFYIFISSALYADAQVDKSYFYERGRELIIEYRYRDAIESLNILLRHQKDDYEGYFLRGIAKYNLDDLRGAIIDFSSAIEINPNYTSAYQYRAITNSRMGRYPESLEDFQKAIAIRPNMPGLYYSRGVTYFLNQQFTQSISDFDQFLILEPRDPGGHINRGTSYLYLKDTTAAVADYDRAIKLNPYQPEAYLRRGVVAISQEKYMESLPDLDKTIELSPNASIAYFYRAMVFSYLDKVMLALDDFDSAIELDPSNSVSIFNRAILRSQIGDYNRAIADYDLIAEHNPDNVLVFFNRANVKVQIGDYRGAINDYSRAIEIYPDFSNAYLFRSQLRLMIGDNRGSYSDHNIAQQKIKEYRNRLNDGQFSMYADTSQQFNKIMALDADFGNENFSRINGVNKDRVELLPMFRISILKNDATRKFETTKYQNQRIDLFLSSMKSAKLGFTNTPGNYPTDSVRLIDSRLIETANNWNTVFMKGITQSLLTQYTSSINYYNFAIGEKPNDPFTYINRSVANAEMVDFITSLEGDYQNMALESDPAKMLKRAERKTYDYSAAIDDLRKAAELMPELPYTFYNLGVLMCNSGDLPKAIEYFSRAIELYPYFAEAYYNRGMVQLHLKDNKTGCMDISKAGELGVAQAYEVLRQHCMK